ncbi:ATP-dependent endonuclease [Kribbella sp. VKM Ac-2566]|uniref:ATP-dependent nuclease n=1 Tax=Kribbella sp. VKM Ac-2566 TaxID=2512218 RepID=UPI001063209E|nr:AAA family ATPase [Kribbella sp. VKM Ac-2566]TDW98499.1 putative AbiEii toxin of type IV toxin-antitoxin system [Kribbella sp. VKM Ac-2566]
MIQIGIERLHLTNDDVDDTPNDGESIDLPSQGIVAIVGPNNAGKSLFLQEMYNVLQIHVAGGLGGAKWITRADLLKAGDVTAYFEENARVVSASVPPTRMLLPAHSPISNERGFKLEQFKLAWEEPPHYPLGEIAKHFSQHLQALDRGRLLKDVETREPGQSPTDPLHFIEDSRELQEKLSRLIRSAFGFPVSINRYRHQLLSLLMGEPTIADMVPPPSPELISEYTALTPVHQQGDGIRCFVGLLVAALSGGPYITLIDEPEAFLHPPQAKLLGRYLAEQPEAGGQLVVATHSSDFLEGLLDGAGQREVAVIRLSLDLEEGVSNRRAHTLPPERVATLWSDPLMRYSRMLDGLFHNGMVICEADNDCRFYAAGIDQYLGQEVAHDLVLTHVGGKGRLAKALQRVRPLHIKTAVIADIDILNNTDTVRSLVEAADGDFGMIEADLSVVMRGVLGENAPPTVRKVKDATNGIVNSRSPDSPLTEPEINQIKDAVRLRSGWKIMKRAGISFLQGAEYNAASNILAYLATVGVFVVPTGELESWYPDVEASHGEAYVTAALESGRLIEMPPALMEFMAALCGYFDLTGGRSDAVE